MIQIKKITFTPADLAAMFVTPQMVIPAPPAGYVNNILAITHELVFNTLAYTGGSDIIYGKSAGNPYSIFHDQVSLPAAGDSQTPVTKAQTPQTIFSTTKDFKVTTDALPATGNSSIDAIIVWEQKIVSP